MSVVHTEAGQASQPPDSTSDLRVGLAWVGRGPVSWKKPVRLPCCPRGCPLGQGRVGLWPGFGQGRRVSQGGQGGVPAYIYPECWDQAHPHSLAFLGSRAATWGKRQSLGVLSEWLLCASVSPSVKRGSYLYPPYIKCQVQTWVRGQANASCY